MALKNRLISLRKSRDLSQTELANQLNMSPGTIGNYENGTRTPKQKQLRQLADFFHVTPEYLLYGEQLTMKQFSALYEQIKEPLFYMDVDELGITGIDRSAIVLAYKARRPIRMDRAEEIADVFDVNLAAIINNPEYAEDDLPENDGNEIELVALYRSMDDPTKAQLLTYARFLTQKGH